MMVECFRCGRGRRCFFLPIRGKFWLKLLFSILITLFQGAGPRGEGGGGRSVWNSRNGRAESVERFWIDYVKGSDKTLGRHGIYRSCFVSKTLKTGESSSFWMRQRCQKHSNAKNKIGDCLLTKEARFEPTRNSTQKLAESHETVCCWKKSEPCQKTTNWIAQSETDVNQNLRNVAAIAVLGGYFR